jgi:hypothetical protein
LALFPLAAVFFPVAFFALFLDVFAIGSSWMIENG